MQTYMYEEPVSVICFDDTKSTFKQAYFIEITAEVNTFISFFNSIANDFTTLLTG